VSTTPGRPILLVVGCFPWGISEIQRGKLLAFYPLPHPGGNSVDDANEEDLRRGA
jgi:hypothetical protein